MTSSLLPDAAPTNWVDRHAPVGLRPWLKLGRFDRPAGIWLLMLPGWQGLAMAAAERGRWPDPWLLLAFLVGATQMRAAGCAFNDIVDRDIDAKVARTAMRPVASGQISVRGALGFLVVCSLLSLAILLALNAFCLVLGVLSLMLVAIYPFMKRITWWPQAWLGLTFNWGALLGYAAAQPFPSVYALAPTLLQPMGGGFIVHLHLTPFLLYASGVFWTLGYDTIYAVQDLEDDALAGVKSSARRLGAGAPNGVLVFYLLAAVLALSAGVAGKLGLLFYPIAGLYAVHLIIQSRRLKIDDPARALMLFKSNRDAGLILLLAIVAGRLHMPLLGLLR